MSQANVAGDMRFTTNLLGDAKKFLIRKSIEVFLAVRALLFVGTKYTCPCCGWKVRAFTHGGVSLRVRPLGYYPRCNSKARHRRDCLFLKEKTNLFSARTRLLYVSPNYCFSRRFIGMRNLEYAGIDYRNHRNVSVKVDLAAVPLCSNAFDAIVCIHVLEHIEQDRQAIGELFRLIDKNSLPGEMNIRKRQLCVKGISAQDLGVVWRAALGGDWMVFWGEVGRGVFYHWGKLLRPV